MVLGLVIQEALKSIEGADDQSVISSPHGTNVVLVEGVKLHLAVRLVSHACVASYRITDYTDGLLTLELIPQASRETLIGTLRVILGEMAWECVPCERGD